MNFIVTGGLGALGRAVTAQLKQSGAKVAAVDIAPASAESGGADVVLGGVDLTDETAVAAAYKQAAEKLGGVDGLVNVAGGFVWELIDGGSLESFDNMYRMNLRTAAVSCRAALPYLKSGGAVVNIGAAAALNAGSGMGSYAASKAGVKALTESLADELKPRGVRVNAVLPTILDTPKNRADMPDADTKQWVTPGAAAKVIAFLLSPEAGAVTGASIPMSMGEIG